MLLLPPLWYFFDVIWQLAAFANCCDALELLSKFTFDSDVLLFALVDALLLLLLSMIDKASFLLKRLLIGSSLRKKLVIRLEFMNEGLLKLALRLAAFIALEFTAIDVLLLLLL